MNKIFVGVAVVASMWISSSVMGAGGITGSAHDFSAASWTGAATNQICAPCHAPHNNVNAAGQLLWNHTMTSNSTYTMYSSPTFTNSPATPSTQSKICLSCHDGTVALDSFGGASGTTVMTGPALVGTDMSNDHPISMNYGAGSGAAGGLHLATDPGVAALLRGGKVECGSCHDPHNNGAGTSKLLQKDNAGSELCLTCHNK